MVRSFPDRQESGAEKGMLDLLGTWSLGGKIEVGVPDWERYPQLPVTHSF